MDDQLRHAARAFEHGDRRRFLSTRRIVLLVVAAAAPLAAMVGNLPFGLIQGVGYATPATYVFAGLTLLLFAVGYGAMSKRVISTGAFYTYIAKGLGRPPGAAAGYSAVLAYVAYTIGMAAFFGYFVALVLSEAGIATPWAAWALGGTAITAFLGYRSIDLSVRVLALLMVAEIGILALFDIVVIAQMGWRAFPSEAFSLDRLTGPGLGNGLMIAFTCFVGFESAALYGEEAENPARSIPRATYISVVMIALFYMLTAWLTIGAVGAAHATELALKDGGAFVMNLTARFAGDGAMALMAILVCTSLLASLLALHNAASRYIFAIARERLLPHALGQFHPKRYAPSRASLVVSILTFLAVGLFALDGRDPYTSLIPSLIGLGTLGIIGIQALAAVAIFVGLRRGANRTTWPVLTASAIGAVGLGTAAWLVADNYDTLAPTRLAWTHLLPWSYVLTAAGGLAYALWMRRWRPAAYSVLAQTDVRAESARAIPQVTFTGKHCVIGAGPNGLLAARALKLAGVPYDQFERHRDVGGIWDLENPGTSMYESAHFISSRFTSAFYGAPMPEHYPDYPDNRQILNYIRDFARRFGLTEAITFGTEVVSAVPVGEGACDGWDVTLSTGETRRYSAIVVANGVTWHPAMPDYPGLEDFAGEARHAVTYRSPSEFAGKRVLIVGGGNSGVDIACDAARHAASAAISLRRGYHFVPKHMFGIPTDLFLAGGIHPPKGVVIPENADDMLRAVVGDLTRLGLPAPDHKAMQSHPIMNSQILHYLAHGDLVARGDIARFTATGVEFQDGRSEDFDLVLFATGYDYRIPFIDPALFEWQQGRPQLYLNIFHRHLRGLAVTGYIEFASAGYQRFDDMAQLVAMDAVIERTGAAGQVWAAMKKEDRPDLRGTSTYVDSPRHANYVDVKIYRRVLAGIREKFGWPDPSDDLYRPLDRGTRQGVL